MVTELVFKKVILAYVQNGIMDEVEMIAHNNERELGVWKWDWRQVEGVVYPPLPDFQKYVVVNITGVRYQVKDPDTGDGFQRWMQHIYKVPTTLHLIKISAPCASNKKEETYFWLGILCEILPLRSKQESGYTGQGVTSCCRYRVEFTFWLKLRWTRHVCRFQCETERVMVLMEFDTGSWNIEAGGIRILLAQRIQRSLAPSPMSQDWKPSYIKIMGYSTQ